MSPIARLLSVVVLTLLLLCTQAGCLLVAAAAGTGATVAYVKGDLDTAVSATPPQVAEATRAAMADLDIFVISTESSAVDAKVVGRTARDTKMTVVAKSTLRDASSVSVRAGTFGDDALQSRLLEAIRARLGPAGSTPNPVAQGTPATQPAVAGTPQN